MSSGYERTRVPNQTLPIEWTVDIATHLNGPWSVVGEVSGTYKIEEDQDLGTDVRLSRLPGAGARWSSRVATRIVPFSSHWRAPRERRCSLPPLTDVAH
jgi:hypothetical protein